MDTEQPEQLPVVDVALPVLDWRHASLLPRRQTCVSCFGLTLLLHPQLRRPMHKTCAEREVAAAARQAERRYRPRD